MITVTLPAELDRMLERAAQPELRGRRKRAIRIATALRAYIELKEHSDDDERRDTTGA